MVSKFSLQRLFNRKSAKENSPVKKTKLRLLGGRIVPDVIRSRIFVDVVEPAGNSIWPNLENITTRKLGRFCYLPFMSCFTKKQYTRVEDMLDEFWPMYWVQDTLKWYFRQRVFK